MPSIETQTSWSWLHDLCIIRQLTNTHQELELSLSKKEIEDLNKGESSSDATSKDNYVTTHDSKYQVPDQLPSPTSEGFIPITDQHIDDPQADISSVSANNDSASNDACKEEHLHLPQIVPQTSQQTGRSHAKSVEVKLPPVFDHLQEIEFPSDREHSNSENSDTDEQDDVDTDLLDEQHPSIKLPNLPWPSILQYLRESESYAARYFSLQNKSDLEKRVRGAGRTQMEATHMEDRTVESVSDESSSPTDSSSEESDSEPSEVKPIESIEKTNTSSKEPKKVTDACDFCGQQKPRYSILSTKSSKHQDRKSEFCCEEYKEFCVLVATCMRQLIDRLKHGPPKKISVKLTKKQIKKTAEQRAFAMMCRKRKWEQLLQKKMQKESSVKKTLKQTRTIQFSLLSSSVLDTGWMVRPQSIMKHNTPRQKKAQVRKNMTEQKRKGAKMNVLPPGLLKRLRAEMPVDGVLDHKQYSNGTPFLTILPNRTGHCYYHSGNSAVVVFAPYRGILAYLLYEDTTRSLLAYLDELGRACCYNSEGKIQLYSNQAGGMTFDPKGIIKRRWSWESDTGSSGTFQPLNLTLNKQLTVKCHSKGSSTMIFTSDHRVIKFSINCKLRHGESLIKLSDLSYVDTMEEHLQNTKRRMSALLQTLQSSNRLTKLAQMRSIYEPTRAIPKQASKSTRQRTKSTGALPIQPHTQPSTLKHLY